jgi:hypothetical protein
MATPPLPACCFDRHATREIPLLQDFLLDPQVAVEVHCVEVFLDGRETVLEADAGTIFPEVRERFAHRSHHGVAHEARIGGRKNAR